MKIGTFVIGGLAGAAVVMMIQRNQKMSAITASVGSNLKQRMNGMKDDAIEKALNMKFASSFTRSKDSASHSRGFSSSEGELDDVKNLIAQDPEVSEQVNEILKHNSHQHN